jgi:hypothetical protein
VRLEGHLKEAGDATVPVHLYEDIFADVLVRVVPVDGEGNTIQTVEEGAASSQEASDEDGSEATGDDSKGDDASET